MSEEMTKEKSVVTTEKSEKQKGKRGFAGWSREKLLEVATRGGKAAHAAGTAHEFSSEEARAAGRKGALASHASVRLAKMKQATP